MASSQWRHGTSVIRHESLSKRNPQANHGSDGSDDTDSPESDASTTSTEDSAYETCSDGSTDVKGASYSDGEEDENLSDITSGRDDHDSQDTASISSDSEGKSRTEARPALMRVRPGGEGGDRPVRLANDPMKAKEQDRPTYPGRPDRLRGPGDRLTATLKVYRLNTNGTLTRVFHHRHEIATLLFCSPPAFHPNEPLVVWPLGGREVLFADYEEKTYFVRTTMPTRPASEYPIRRLDTNPGNVVLLTRRIPLGRIICMKPHFSPCGGYLHIASVEGSLSTGPGEAARKRTSEPSPRMDAQTKDGKANLLVLSMLLTTHRLSTTKTTRSSRRFIRKAAIVLGTFSGLSLARLPFTFTWTPSHLYFTVSSRKLKVFRLPLFPSTPEPQISVPRLPIPLPRSSSNREVQYLPPRPGGPKHGVVLMGSYWRLRDHVELVWSAADQRPGWEQDMGEREDYDRHVFNYDCPAVGFYVDEETDLGGWVKMAQSGAGETAGVADLGSAELSSRLGSGRLRRKTEVFDQDDDLDLETIWTWRRFVGSVEGVTFFHSSRYFGSERSCISRGILSPHYLNVTLDEEDNLLWQLATALYPFRPLSTTSIQYTAGSTHTVSTRHTQSTSQATRRTYPRTRRHLNKQLPLPRIRTKRPRQRRAVDHLLAAPVLFTPAR